MSVIAKATTNVTLIRDFRRHEDPSPSLSGDPISSLIERWEAPVMSEEEIEAWATRYRLCPKTGMSFVEYLIVRGVGSAA